VVSAAPPGAATLFASDAWTQTVASFSAVTHLTVQVYGLDGRPLGGAPLAAGLYGVFAPGGRLDAEFAAGAAARRAAGGEGAVIREAHGLATVAVPFRLGDEDVAVGVAGVGLVAHLDEAAARRLAREHGLPFEAVWEAVRDEVPVSRQRLALCGALLAMLGEALLRDEARARQLRQASEELANSLRLKDEFLAVLSHELRTPLTPILSWTQILRHRPDTARVQEAVEVIERNVRHQIALVDDLLDLNRIQRAKVALDVQPRDLGEIVRLAVQSLAEPARQKGLVVGYHAPPAPVLVAADAERLGQVFTNLLSNAIKFTPSGGRVSVALTATDDRAVVRVRDTGAGIAAEFLPHVFEMFRQQEQGACRRHGGLGIGLALARRLTELHGGTIRAASPGVGRGTEMTVSLPRLPADHAPIAMPAQGRLALLPRFEGLAVMVVEDSADTGLATCRMLEHLGARVTLAADGRQGLDAFERVRPAVVLCDLRMPLMDGFEFLRQLRAREDGARVPVIACSGLVSPEDRRRVQDAGFTASLTKPFDYDALAAALETALRLSRRQSSAA
jgi:signal transduction histidine kinase/CheY-like chemotaxis protein